MTDTNKDTIILPLKIARVPMSHAFKWIKNAFILLKAQPLIMVLASTWIILTQMLFTGILPAVGIVLFFIIVPGLAFGMANLCQSVRIQEPTSPLSIYTPLFNPVRNRLLSLGLIYATVLFGIFLISQTFINQDILNDTMKKMVEMQNLNDIEAIRAQSAEILTQLAQNKGVLLASALMSAGYILVQILLIYSPMFAVWQNMQAPQAVIVSIRTILKNLLPVILSMILVGVIFFIASIALTLITMHLPSIFMFAMMGLWMIFNTLISAITYTSYYDIIRTSMNDSVQNKIEVILNTTHSEK